MDPEHFGGAGAPGPGASQPVRIGSDTLTTCRCLAGLATDISFPKFWRLEVQNQGAGEVGFCESSPPPLPSLQVHLLAVWSHGPERARSRPLISFQGHESYPGDSSLQPQPNPTTSQRPHLQIPHLQTGADGKRAVHGALQGERKLRRSPATESQAPVFSSSKASP